MSTVIFLLFCSAPAVVIACLILIRKYAFGESFTLMFYSDLGLTLTDLRNLLRWLERKVSQAQEQAWIRATKANHADIIKRKGRL